MIGLINGKKRILFNKSETDGSSTEIDGLVMKMITSIAHRIPDDKNNYSLLDICDFYDDCKISFEYYGEPIEIRNPFPFRIKKVLKGIPNMNDNTLTCYFSVCLK